MHSILLIPHLLTPSCSASIFYTMLKANSDLLLMRGCRGGGDGGGGGGGGVYVFVCMGVSLYITF